MNIRLLLCFLLLFTAGTAAQETHKSRSELIGEVEADQRAAKTCEKEAEKEQIKRFGKPLPRLSGHCWDGCPTKVVLPYYPAAARRWKLKGRVSVRTIVDEEGNVIFADFVKGNRIFKQAALAAAYDSTYMPKSVCGRRVKFWWLINFTFQPN